MNKNNYSTLLTSDLREDIQKNALEKIAPILGKTEVDETVTGVIAAIDEIVDRMFGIGHILAPHEIFQRGSHFFHLKPGAKPTPLPRAKEVFERKSPEALSDEVIMELACYVKSRVLSLFYKEFIGKLRKDLISSASKSQPPANPWNSRIIRVGERESLHNFLKSTAAPTETENWFQENFLKNLPESWISTYNAEAWTGAQTLPKPFVLYKNNGKSVVKKTLVDAHSMDISNIPVVRELASQVEVFEKIDQREGVERDWLINDFHLANAKLALSMGKELYARSFKNGSLDASDFVSEGNIGMVKGMKKFDPTRGYRFSTYASWWVRQQMNRHLHSFGRTIRLPVHRIELLNKIEKELKEFTNKKKRPPSPEELAAVMGIETEKLIEMMFLRVRPVSMESPLEDADGKTLGDTLSTDEDFEGELEDSNTSEILARKMQEILTPRELAILKMRFGIPGTASLTAETDQSEESMRKHMASIADEIGSYSVETLSSEIVVHTEEELLPIATLIEKTEKIAEVKEAKILYTLTNKEVRSLRGLSSIIREAVNDPTVEVRCERNILIVECPHSNQEGIGKIKAAIPQFLTKNIHLNISGVTTLRPKNGMNTEEIQRYLEEEFTDKINSCKKKNVYQINVEVLANEHIALEAIAKMDGVSRERVRQVENDAKRKLYRHGIGETFGIDKRLDQPEE